MENLTGPDYKKYAAMAICFASLAALILIFGKYAISLLLPFIIGYGMASLAISISRRVRKQFRIKGFERLANVTTLTVLLTVLGLFSYFTASRLVYEGGRLLKELENGGTLRDVVIQIRVRAESVLERIPFMRGALSRDFGPALDGIAGQVSDGLGKWLTAFLGGILGAMPSILLFVTVTVISCYYFCLESHRVGGALISLLPKGIRCAVPDLKERISGTALGYVKAYAILFSVTVSLLMIGLLILRVQYALLLAIVIAIVDLLPVVGMGMVLIPWGVFALLSGDTVMGIGIFILFAVISITHQVLEPRLLGKGLGLHPLVTLLSMYIGFRLFGITGMISGPIAATIITAALNAMRTADCAQAPD